MYFGSEEFTDEVGHGTHIAGTIAEGTPSNVKIYPIKVAESQTLYDSDIITAINYIVYNNIADVINMSFGSYYENESMYAAIAAAKEKNIICVAAAGNESTSVDCYPACYDNTISVSSVTSEMERSYFSNYNDTVTFAAPGSGIVSINGISSGTSMATPHVVSAVSICKLYNKNYTLNNVIDVLKPYCIDLGESGKDNQFGYGVINLKNIIYCACECEICDEIYCLGCDCLECNNCVSKEENKNISKIEIDNNSCNVLQYNYGSITNLSNVLVNVVYSDSSTEQIKLLDLEDCKISGYNPYSYEEQTVTITYKGMTTSFNINASSEYELGWTYELSEYETIKLTGFKISDNMNNIKLYLPEKINNYDVTELGEKLFYQQDKLNKVFMNSNIKIVGDNVFYQCLNLDKVEMSDNIQSIGDSAFYECKLLSEIKMPNSLISIGNNAFYNCKKLSNINISNNVKNIGQNAFAYNAITVIQIPEGIEVLQKGIFSYCYNLDKVTLPSTLKSIEDNAFYECSNLKNLEIPASVESISNSAFVKCSSLSSIVVDDSNEVYDSREDCNGIIETETNTLIAGSNNIKIPGTIKVIGENSLSDRLFLTYIDIPEGVVTIEANAFANCLNLEKVIMPRSVTSIESNSFSKCDLLIMYVYKDSYSKQYAEKNKIEYRYLDKTINKVSLYQFTKTEYKAFEKVLMDGVKIKVTYDDDTFEYISEGYNIEYENGLDSFRYGDTKFILSYNQNNIEFKVDVPVTVVKAIPEYSIPTNVTAKVGQSLSNIVLPEGFEWMDSNIVLDEIGSVNYKARFVPKDNVNYATIENINILVQVSKAIPVEITNVEGITKTTYTAFETVSEENISITILYDSGVSVSKTQGYEIKYMTENDGFRYGDTKYVIEYKEDDVVITKEIDVVVNKVIPNYIVPVDLKGNVGGKLADITLPKGFEWMDSSIVLDVSGDKIYKARFIPEDTINYQIIENIEVVINVSTNIESRSLKGILEIGGINKTQYIAFETVSEPDMFIKVEYDNGETEIVNNNFQIKYIDNMDSFRYGHTKYVVEYEENGIKVCKDVNVNVKKATPTYNIPEGLNAKRGQKLSEIALPNGFNWKDKNLSIIDIGNIKFKATYSPSDIVNYNVVDNIDIIINVIKEEQSISFSDLKYKNSYLYNFKVKSVDLNNNVTSSYKVKQISNDIKLSDNLIYEAYNASNKKMSMEDSITTGCELKIYSQPDASIKDLIRTYYAVIYGDTNCDGVINSGDLLAIKKHLLETKKIENNAAKEAADINQDNGINSADLLFLKKHLLGKQIISQNKY